MNAAEIFTGIFAIHPATLEMLVSAMPSLEGAINSPSRAKATMTQRGTAAIIDVSGFMAPNDSPMLSAFGGTSIDSIRATDGLSIASKLARFHGGFPK